MISGPTPTLARAIVRSLSRGTSLADGIKHIHVGHRSWLAAQAELLGEIAEDGNADAKFVRGSYGAGKSHFLGLVQEEARGCGWVTAHLECSADQVEIDRFETLYAALAGKLRLNAGSDDAVPDDPMRDLLERWSAGVRRDARIRDDGIARPFDADERVFRRLAQTLHRSGLSADFIAGLTAFALAELEEDLETVANVVRWLRAGVERIAVPRRCLLKPNIRTSPASGLQFLAPIGRGNSTDAMRGLLWVIRAAGYSGLVLCIDEIEELAKLRAKKRQDQSLQALREFVDHAGGQGAFRHLCMYLAATPEMFESPDYFPRYDALQTRIQPVSDRVNWRGPVIDLDKTPLSREEMRVMAGRIAAVHRIAYPNADAAAVSEDYLDTILNEVVDARARVAKPRLLTRVVVDELERARQESTDYRRASPGSLVTSAAGAVVREAEA